MPNFLVLLSIIIGIVVASVSYRNIYKAARRPANGEKWDLLNAERYCRTMVAMANRAKFEFAKQRVPEVVAK